MKPLRKNVSRLLSSSCLSRFARDDGGNVAMIFALSAIPIFGLTAAAVDYAGASRQQSKMQTACDLGVLIGMSNVNQPDAAVKSIVQNSVEANLRNEVTNLVVDTTITADRRKLSTTLTGNYSTSMMGLFGYDHMPVSSNCEATTGQDRLEVAIALDVTGSMQMHMPTLRQAARDLLLQLYGNQNTSSTVRTALVPFVTTVNVGNYPSRMSWMDTTGDALYHGENFENVTIRCVNIPSPPAPPPPPSPPPSSPPSPPSPPPSPPAGPPPAPPAGPPPGPPPAPPPGPPPGPPPSPPASPPSPPPPPPPPPPPVPPPPPPPAPPPPPPPKPSSDGWLEPGLVPSFGPPVDVAQSRSVVDDIVDAAKTAAAIAIDAIGPTPAYAQSVPVRPWPYGDLPTTPVYNNTSKWLSTLPMGATGCSSTTNGVYRGFNAAGTTPTKVNHFDLFTAMGVSWKGCVEVRPAPYDTDDTAPGGVFNTRFVPWLWPDEYNNDSPAPTPNPTITTSVPIAENNIGQKEPRVRNNYLNDRRTRANAATAPFWLPWWVTANAATAGSQSIATGTNAGVSTNNTRIWDLRRAWLWKYRDSNPVITPVVNTADRFWETGPNAGCPDPIVPLTNDRIAVDNAVQALKSNWGQGTNNMEGLAWAWRVLSPGEPFTEGLAYGTPNNKKIIVLMTDGQNESTRQPSDGVTTQTPNLSDYTSTGYAVKARLGSNVINTIGTTIDSKVTTVCNNVKARDITIFTVLFDPNGGALPQSISDIFRNCATDPGKYYKASSQAELLAAFSNVASEISKLRLTK